MGEAEGLATPVGERVRRLICVCLDVPEDSVRPELSWQQLGADSLDLVELVLALEDEFEVRFESKELNSLKTVSDLLAAVERQARGGRR